MPTGNPEGPLKIKKAKVKLHHSPNRDSFDVWGKFVLGDNSDGTDALNEDVIVTFNGYTETIPAGSFVRYKKHFEYKEPQKGAIMKIKLKDDGRFEVKAKGLDLDGIDLNDPVSYSLQVGDDLGETEIQFNKKGKFKKKR